MERDTARNTNQCRRRKEEFYRPGPCRYLTWINRSIRPEWENPAMTRSPNTWSFRESGGRVRLLLINPRFPESFWSFRWALQEILPSRRAVNPPLGLATVAALTPDDWEITILDENIEALPMNPEADIVGVGGMAVQYGRQRELLDYYRSRGHYVVAGGSYASLSPDSYSGYADTIVVGEAEHTWPEFCRNFAAGDPRGLYRQDGWADLADSPTPRFDLLKLDRYTTASLQFSRGCPYQCEFCDIPVLFGRRPRTKTLDQVGRELDSLRKAGARNVFFVDDNLIGHQPRARELLGYLAEYQRSHEYPFGLGTEASVNLAGNGELLELFRNAGFRWVFLGIETPDPESLAEAGKKQNLKSDLLEAVYNFYRNGISVFSGFIVGFDHDTPKSFSRLYRFILRSGIQVAMLGLLTAVPRTPLYERLEREGRLRHDVPPGDNTGGATNVIPLGMSYQEMVDGYSGIYRDLCSDGAIAKRIRNKLRHFGPPRWPGRQLRRESLTLAWRVLANGILRGGPRRAAAFIWSLAGFSPRLWTVALQDWAYALSIRAYARRHIAAAREREHALLHRSAAQLSKRLRKYQSTHRLQFVTAHAGNRLGLKIVVRRSLAAKEARILSRLTRRLMARAPAVRVTLQLHEVAVPGRAWVHDLFEPLRRYADRITVQSQSSLLSWLDSSVFHIATIDGQ